MRTPIIHSLVSRIKQANAGGATLTFADEPPYSSSFRRGRPRARADVPLFMQTHMLHTGRTMAMEPGADCRALATVLAAVAMRSSSNTNAVTQLLWLKDTNLSARVITDMQ